MSDFVAKKRISKKEIFILILLALIVVFIFFPRRHSLKDGGTVTYESCFSGVVYTIEQRHRLQDNGYYENGIAIYIAGIEIFNNSEIDNSVPAETRSSDVESLSEEIDRVVYKT